MIFCLWAPEFLVTPLSTVSSSRVYASFLFTVTMVYSSPVSLIIVGVESVWVGVVDTTEDDERITDDREGSCGKVDSDENSVGDCGRAVWLVWFSDAVSELVTTGVSDKEGEFKVIWLDVVGASEMGGVSLGTRNTQAKINPTTSKTHTTMIILRVLVLFSFSYLPEQTIILSTLIKRFDSTQLIQCLFVNWYRYWLKKLVKFIKHQN